LKILSFVIWFIIIISVCLLKIGEHVCLSTYTIKMCMQTVNKSMYCMSQFGWFYRLWTSVAVYSNRIRNLGSSSCRVLFLISHMPRKYDQDNRLLRPERWIQMRFSTFKQNTFYISRMDFYNSKCHFVFNGLGLWLSGDNLT